MAYSCRMEAGGALASSRGRRDEYLVCDAFFVTRHVLRFWRGDGTAFSAAAHDMSYNRAVLLVNSKEMQRNLQSAQL